MGSLTSQVVVASLSRHDNGDLESWRISVHTTDGTHQMVVSLVREMGPKWLFQENPSWWNIIPFGQIDTLW